MPFKMFIISHPRAKDYDLSDLQEPLIRFISDPWAKRDLAAATLSCIQFIAKKNTTDPVELWGSLPSDLHAPLASFVWSKDPEKFNPGSPDIQALSNLLRSEYPLLSLPVKGEIPHPAGPVTELTPRDWRSLIWTSKYDVELHGLIAQHFECDFNKVFTKHYVSPDQPPFPYFDHRELIIAQIGRAHV
jgi:spatacsin